MFRWVCVHVSCLWDDRRGCWERPRWRCCVWTWLALHSAVNSGGLNRVSSPAPCLSARSTPRWDRTPSNHLVLQFNSTPLVKSIFVTSAHPSTQNALSTLLTSGFSRGTEPLISVLWAGLDLKHQLNHSITKNNRKANKIFVLNCTQSSFAHQWLH